MISWISRITRTRLPAAAQNKPKPNLTGLWQSIGTADWDIQGHGAEAGPFYQLGAIGAVPPGQSIVALSGVGPAGVTGISDHPRGDALARQLAFGAAVGVADPQIVVAHEGHVAAVWRSDFEAGALRQ